MPRALRELQRLLRDLRRLLLLPRHRVSLQILLLLLLLPRLQTLQLRLVDLSLLQHASQRLHSLHRHAHVIFAERQRPHRLDRVAPAILLLQTRRINHSRFLRNHTQNPIKTLRKLRAATATPLSLFAFISTSSRMSGCSSSASKSSGIRAKISLMVLMPSAMTSGLE